MMIFEVSNYKAKLSGTYVCWDSQVFKGAESDTKRTQGGRLEKICWLSRQQFMAIAGPTGTLVTSSV